MKHQKLVKKTTNKVRKGQVIKEGDYWLKWGEKSYTHWVVGEKFDGIGDLRRPV